MLQTANVQTKALIASNSNTLSKETKSDIKSDTKSEIQINGKIKKVRACPYYSPFKAICVNRNHPGYDVEFNRQPRCSFRGKYSGCSIVDKVIELTLDENNVVIHREYLYIKGRIDLSELEKSLKDEDMKNEIYLKEEAEEA